MGHFKQINVVLVCTSCLLDTVYNKQRLNIRFGHLEIGLDHGFGKRCLNLTHRRQKNALEVPTSFCIM